MKIKINKGDFLERLSLASHFTSVKLTSLPILQGVLIKVEKEKTHFYSSNLNSFFHTNIKVLSEKTEEFIIEPKKITEFISLLPEGKIEIETKNKQLFIISGKTTGKFPLMNTGDFAFPPKIEEKEHKIKTDFFVNKLPLVLFSASNDETRPALSGINFLTEDELIVVATDGFRLSFLKTNKDKEIPSVIIPAEFLREIIRFIKDEKELGFYYSDKEKIIMFKVGNDEFYSRLIEGDFPPFEKVIPQDKKTTITVDREDLLRGIKLISVFAREFSNIVVFELQNEGIKLRPKMDDEGGNSTFIEAKKEGENQRIAFNYKFLLDFLNNINSKKIIIEVLRPDAPVVFKMEEDHNFIHIIMPVRIQE